MSKTDKARHKIEEVNGTIKAKTGEASSDEDLQARGEAEQATGKLKQAGDSITDAIKH
jgi:uncharacterized protein YjbJ (UPF0337 family)